MLTQRIQLFLIGTAALLPLLFGAMLMWRRFYRDDPTNTARRVVKNSAIPTLVRLIVRAIDMAFALVLFRLLLLPMAIRISRVWFSKTLRLPRFIRLI